MRLGRVSDFAFTVNKIFCFHKHSITSEFRKYCNLISRYKDFNPLLQHRHRSHDVIETHTIDDAIALSRKIYSGDNDKEGNTYLIQF
jgi:hypothetical protein